jgi:hypothetical protein
LAAAKWSPGRIGARLKRSPRVVKIRALLNGISLAADKREVVGHAIPPGASYRQSEQEMPSIVRPAAD